MKVQIQESDLPNGKLVILIGEVGVGKKSIVKRFKLLNCTETREIIRKKENSSIEQKVIKLLNENSKKIIKKIQTLILLMILNQKLKQKIMLKIIQKKNQNKKNQNIEEKKKDQI